jgi:hypothetical protein
MTQARDLSQHTLDTLIHRAHLQEVHGADGGAFMSLQSAFGKVGDLRLFHGEKVTKLVYIGMTVAQFGLDSHMIFAFTPPSSPVPHFTLDSVMNGADNFAFHLDLIPRVDLGANLDYLFNVFSGLDGHFEATGKIEGLTPARLGPTQYAIMSPWMLAYRANTSAFAAITDPVNAYLEHWFNLLENGVGDLRFDAETLAERDRLNRAAIFNPKVDRVWAQVDRLLGAETSAFLQSVLKNQQVEHLEGATS